MDNLEDLLDKDDILSRVVWYELRRMVSDDRDARVLISVVEILNGDQKGWFLPMPTLLLRRARDEYIGYGSRAEEALNDCLKKIKGLQIDAIIDMQRE
jgi:hypothetical protein